MFKYLSLLRYLPVVLAIIPHIEALFGAKEGEAKKAAVIGLTVAVFNAAGMNVKPAQLETLSELVDEIVGTFNRFGVFQKSGADELDELATAAETVLITGANVKVELAGEAARVVAPVVKAVEAAEDIKREARLAELEAILTESVLK